MKKWLCLFVVFFTQLISFGLFAEPDYFLTILVTARQLNYNSGHELFTTMAKHPSDWSKNGDVGHAWIYLRGKINGEAVYIEGGHSGELGHRRPKYFEGVMNYNLYGYSDPDEEEKRNPRYEPNPVKYLWASPKDGFFQQGCGGHIPTYAARVDLSKESFDAILTLIHPSKYDYANYSITCNQCSSFARQVAAAAGLHLEDKVTMRIEPRIKIFGGEIRLWTDPEFSTITFSSPDVLEKSLKLAVREGRAVDATLWYKKSFPKTTREVFKEWVDSFNKLPERWSRAFLLG